MAYNKADIFEKAKQLIAGHTLYFIEDVVSLLPCAKSSFYEWYPIGSDEMDAIKALLEVNRVSTKVAMRSKWYESENATLQVALMKLIATDDEAHRLNGTKTENKSDVNVTGVNLKDIVEFK